MSPHHSFPATTWQRLMIGMNMWLQQRVWSIWKRKPQVEYKIFVRTQWLQQTSRNHPHPELILDCILTLICPLPPHQITKRYPSTSRYIKGPANSKQQSKPGRRTLHLGNASRRRKSFSWGFKPNWRKSFPWNHAGNKECPRTCSSSIHLHRPPLYP